MQEINNSQMLTRKTRDKITVKRQILTNVRKSLAALSEKREKETGRYIAPTKDEVRAECLKRWQQHLDRMKGKEDITEYFE